METYNDIWDAVLEYCKGKVSETGYKLWLKTVEIGGFENNSFVLIMGSAVKKKIVMEQYGSLIEEALEQVLGFKINVEYRFHQSIFDEVEDENNKEKEQQNNNQNIKRGNDQFTFDNFIEGPSNRFAYRAAIAVSKNPGGINNGADSLNYNPLFIYGKSGLGKTHILNAICHEISINFPEMRILYVRCEDFVNEFISALGKKTIDEFHDKFRNIDILLIDDIQFIGGKDRTEEEFFHTFNSLVENGKQIVLTSDRPPKEIRSLTERLCTRFEKGLLADIQSPEYETRCAIIKSKAKMINFDISDAIVNYVAEKIKTNIRQLEGITVRLHAMSQLSGEKPTIALAQKVIKDVIDDTQQPVPVTIEKIVEEVSRTEGISVEDIYGKKQKANITHARKIAMYIIREVTNTSYEAIGEKFNKHHSTVMYNIQQISEEMETDSRLNRVVNDMINNIKDMEE